MKNKPCPAGGMHIHRVCRYCVSSFFQAYDRGYGGEGMQAADKI